MFSFYIAIKNDTAFIVHSNVSDLNNTYPSYRWIGPIGTREQAEKLIPENIELSRYKMNLTEKEEDAIEKIFGKEKKK